MRMLYPRRKSGGAEVAAPLPIAALGALYAVEFSNEIEKYPTRSFSRPAGARLRGGV
jgi:hypothetical protein